MAEKTLHSLKSNATRLGQRLGENLAGKWAWWSEAAGERRGAWGSEVAPEYAGRAAPRCSSTRIAGRSELGRRLGWDLEELLLLARSCSGAGAWDAASTLPSRNPAVRAGELTDGHRVYGFQALGLFGQGSSGTRS